MLSNLKRLLFPILIAFSALSVSASAAFYSISGLSKLFAGAALAVIIMAASLEIAKLVIASLLYQYRKTLPKILKWYLSLACIILILITSMGIYGFLSAAYQETAAKSGTIEAQIALVEVKRDNVKEQLLVYNEEKSSINGAVSSLRNGLSTNRIQYTDTLGNVINTTSSSTRRALENQLDQAIERQNIINSKVDILNEDLFKYETEIVEIKISDAVSSELGPLKYLSGLTGIPMDRIINYLLLTIIFVFDPLAIALVIAANFAFDQIKPRTKKNLYGEKVKIKPFIEITEKDIESDLKHGQEDINEDRMNIIGQNGNDGLHYDNLEEQAKHTDEKEDKLRYVGYQPPKTDINQEILELGRILGQDLTADQIEQIKKSKQTQALGNKDDDDDLKIIY